MPLYNYKEDREEGNGKMMEVYEENERLAGKNGPQKKAPKTDEECNLETNE